MTTNVDILAAIINAAATVFAAAIGGASVLIVALHRKAVIDLAKFVEAFYELETALLIRQLQEKGNNEPSENQIRQRRGVVRKEILGDNQPERWLTARQARRIHARYFSYE
ncbi:hypothetical protein TDMWS_09650 [Thermodesulfomicrobium sp. WS]|uniref:hypothetical protein n=1 Tax=Thermodesulfomicrobium sp. WS TaxID=3004129 RepID=UPI00248FE6C0|nr:hypothetical protein [Thermodesulfomicrobium sp. WS]BDV00880.1 hypothetical protein TDMWS_09650 [Thermodesulfomicrobium sp. WS]